MTVLACMHCQTIWPGCVCLKINTGCREQEVCRLRWEWEIKVPELDTSVFIIPGAGVRNGEDRLVVLELGG